MQDPFLPVKINVEAGKSTRLNIFSITDGVFKNMTHHNPANDLVIISMYLLKYII